MDKCKMAITMAKNIIILGSTGSLGTQTLEVIKRHPKFFKIWALTANKNEKLLKKQAKIFNVKHIFLASKNKPEKLEKILKLKKADIVVNMLSSTEGIKSSIMALKNKKTLIAGNKESLVTEGEKLIKFAKKFSKTFHKNLPPKAIIPVDSEHNAIYEIIQKHPNKKIKNIILPCSGGAFFNKKKNFLKKIKFKNVKNHPKWEMGEKISIESATLLNKGFEMIEAYHFFNLPLSKIKPKLHPECKIHGIVEFEAPNKKTEKIGYFAKPDMKEHIENALFRSINLSPPKRKIKNCKKEYESFQKIPTNTHLEGIKIVKNLFKNHNNPSEIKKFLKYEEKIFGEFKNNKIGFFDIFSLLNKRIKNK